MQINNYSIVMHVGLGLLLCMWWMAYFWDTVWKLLFKNELQYRSNCFRHCFVLPSSRSKLSQLVACCHLKDKVTWWRYRRKSQSLTLSMYNVYRPYGTIRNKICIARIFPFSPGTPWLSWTKFLSLKFWRRNLDYAKNLQEKYFTGENIIIIFQYFNTGVPYVQFRNSSEGGGWGSSLKSRKSLWSHSLNNPALFIILEY